MIKIIITSLFALLYCSCSERSQTASEANLETAVAEAKKTFASGNTESIANLFYTTERLTRDRVVKFAENIKKSPEPLDFNLESCKVSGSMGIVLLSFNKEKSEYPYFAKWENGRWKFFLDFIAWQSPVLTRKLPLNESEMKDALILQKWATSQPLVGASGINAQDRLAWYVPYVPNDLQIEKFYETPSPSMDHTYMWKIKIAENDTFKKFAEQFTQSPINVDGVNDYGEVPSFDTHPDWWRSIDFKKYKVYQYRVVCVPPKSTTPHESSERAYLFAFFDKQGGYLYVQAF